MAEFKLHHHLWKTESVVPQFQTTVTIKIMQEDDLQPTERQREVLSSLTRLPDDLPQTINVCAVEYYRKLDALVNFASEGRAIDEQAISEHYLLKSILIPEIRKCRTNYFFASFDCDWEEEHGMRVLVADGEIITCGAHDSLPFSPQWARIISLPDKTEQIDFLKSLQI